MDKQRKIETLQRILAAGPVPDAAHAAATVLIEDTREGGAFFVNEARRLLQAVITALMLNAPETWTMADVAKITQDWERTKKLLSRQPATARIAERLSTTPSAAPDVLATLNGSLHSWLPDTLCALPVRPEQRQGERQGRPEAR